MDLSSVPLVAANVTGRHDELYGNSQSYQFIGSTRDKKTQVSG